jgi:Sigma-70 region 2
VGRDDDGTSPARRPVRDEVERLLAERGEHLMHAAIALTGSRQEGEDLLQAALERLLRHWGRIEGDPEGYLRRTLWLDQRAQGPGTLTGDFRWVQPSTENLAALRVTVPGGFRQAGTGGLPVPGLNL